jgi:hypothetical protein
VLFGIVRHVWTMCLIRLPAVCVFNDYLFFVVVFFYPSCFIGVCVTMKICINHRKSFCPLSVTRGLLSAIYTKVLI